MIYMLYDADDDLLATSDDDTVMRHGLDLMIANGLMDAADRDLVLGLVADVVRPGIWMVLTRPDVCRTMERLIRRRVVRLRGADPLDGPGDELCFCIDLTETPLDDLDLVQQRIARDFRMPMDVLKRNWMAGGILVPADAGVIVMVPG